MNKNFLIFGGGSKFGLKLAQELDLGGNVFVVSSTQGESPGRFYIDWLSCDFMSVEKILKSIPKIDIVIFNQNYCHVPETIDFSMPKPLQWKQGRHWAQAHFVNSLLPCQVLNSLIVDGKFDSTSMAVWMLSGAITNDQNTMLGYRAQKMLNAQIVRSASRNNPGQYVGFDPGTLSAENQLVKARLLAEFLQGPKPSSLYYEFNPDLTAVIAHEKIGYVRPSTNQNTFDQ
jgi:hypothetical protein